MAKNINGEGSTRKLSENKWECIIQSKYINPKTGNYKRIKRISTTESSAREKAQMALAAWEKEIERGRDTKINKAKTFGSYMEEFIDNEVKPSLTASGYHSYISNMRRNFYPFTISKLQLHMLSAKEFEEYYNTILGLKSKKTCALPMQLCKRCCQWLIDRSLIKENYAKQVALKKEVIDEYSTKQDENEKARKKIFTYEDIEKFYYAYKNNMGQYAVVALFLLETGLRANEFTALRIDNIDFDKNRIDIVESQAVRFIDNDKEKGLERYTKVPKNKEARFIMMSDLCRECALYMIEQTKLNCKSNPDNLLYPIFSNGKRRSLSTMEVGFKSLCDKLEIDRDIRLTKTGQRKGLCLHSLRHTADTIANTAKGANVVNTALMMGHKAVSMENTYTHATEEALSQIVTPSQAVLENYKKDDINNPKSESDKEKELYEMYLKLKEKFESES